MDSYRDEIQILEYHQDSEIQRHIQNQDCLSRHFVISAVLNPSCKQIVKTDGGHHHEHKSRFAPGIEKQAGNQEPVVTEFPGKQKIDSVRDRKKEKKKLNTGEEHRPGFSSFGNSGWHSADAEF